MEFLRTFLKHFLRISGFGLFISAYIILTVYVANNSSPLLAILLAVVGLSGVVALLLAVGEFE